jgi:bacterioferritin-associated ferredoxin
VVNYIRLEKPRRASQLSECYGAGTGCGWCRPFLERLFEQAQTGSDVGAAAPESDEQEDLPSAEAYAAGRGEYIVKTDAKPPPGATPPPD